MLGKWPDEYHSNPNPHPDKVIEQIWADFDAYSFEELYEMPSYQKSLRFNVPLPPLQYKGKFIKGICYTQGAHLLIEQFPDIKKLFFVCANAMCASYPWSHKADCFFTCYRNLAREKHYKIRYPETKDIVCLPLQDADFTDETLMKPTIEAPNSNIPKRLQQFTPQAPRFNFQQLLRRITKKPEKTIDVFCVSTPFPVKNLPTIAKALLVYEKKYGRRLKVVYTIGDRAAKKRVDGSFDYSEIGDYGKPVLAEVDKILGDTKAYIDFIPFIEYRDLPKYYSAAKCGVLGSLFEGKNRFIQECMCCNTPVITFKDYNKFTRGDHPIFFGNSGKCAPEFSPESLADTIHKVITNPNAYSPRKNYLKHSGRRNFINTFLREIPYYRENLPYFRNGDALSNNWLKSACLDNYGVDFKSFLYDDRSDISNIVGLENIHQTIQTYCDKFNIPWYEIPPEKHEPIRDGAGLDNL